MKPRLKLSGITKAYPTVVANAGIDLTVLAATPARIRWIDGREDDFPAAVAGDVEIVATDAPAAELAEARPGAYVVVTTHSHALDYDIVAAALARRDWRYLGLIGSRAKRAQFEKRWAVHGGAPGAFARVTCPIGAGPLALSGKEPGVIAVATAAEVLALREGRISAGGNRDRKSGAEL